MSRPTPRRPASSRRPTPRPRKIAGQSMVARPGTAGGTDATGEPETHVETDVAEAEVLAPEVLEADGDPALEPDAETGPGGLLASPRVTRVLIGLVAALAVVLGVLAVVLVLEDDEGGATARDTAGVSVPADRPVVADELAVQDGVESAAKAASELFSVDYSKYDEEVASAVELTTRRYEEEYRRTISDVKEQATSDKVVVQTNIVAQGVVRANRTELEALLFANQVVQRTREGKPETVLTPLKILVTMVHTDQGWLVDDLDTDAPKGGETD